MLINKKKFTGLFPALLLAVLAGWPLQSRATVVTFDNLPDPGDSSPAVPDGYGGINWSAGGWDYFNEVQSPYTAHSGLNRVFSYNVDNRFFFTGSGVVFDGAWFSGGSHWDDGSPTNDEVTLDLYFHGTLVDTSNTLKLTATPTFLASGYTGLVDAVGISESPVMRPANTDFVMDDVTFHSADAPEPRSLVFVLIGLFAAGFRHRRGKCNC